jgi:hypothetical protein
MSSKKAITGLADFQYFESRRPRDPFENLPVRVRIPGDKHRLFSPRCGPPFSSWLPRTIRYLAVPGSLVKLLNVLDRGKV